MAPPPYSSFLDTSVSVPACIGRASFVFCSSLSVLQRSLSFPLDFSPLPEEDRRVLCVARYTGVRCRWGIYIYIYIACVSRFIPLSFLSPGRILDRPTNRPFLHLLLLLLPLSLFFFLLQSVCVHVSTVVVVVVVVAVAVAVVPPMDNKGRGRRRASV